MTFTERPILFSGAMVRAILDGRKTMTRRVVKPQPTFEKGYWCSRGYVWKNAISQSVDRSPYGVPGDRLWVRETWGLHDHEKPGYKATATDDQLRLWKWKPSIHMPRKYSRLTLEVLNVRVERLQEISAEDCMAEGTDATRLENTDTAPRLRFYNLWDSINAKRGYGWNANPWVWCVTFKPISPTAGAGGSFPRERGGACA